jgi:sugar phosphate isomerase/epimerase
MPIVPGLQLVATRSFPPLAARLHELAELGYGKVEPYDALLRDAGGLAAMLGQFNLACPSIHAELPRFRNDVQRVIGLADLLHAGLVVIPKLAPEEHPEDTPGWMRFAAELAGYAIKLKTAGKRLAWHNREREFTILPDGSRPIEHLFEASPDILWEIDVAWMVRAGQDPSEWIQRWPERIVAAHLKDMAESPSSGELVWADLGHGMLDWGLIVPALKKAGCQHWYAEHGTPLDFHRFAERAIATMRSW